MNVFLEIFSKFSEQPFCRTLPVSCFSNLLKSSGWMTVISFFFGHLSVFWVFFSSVRVTLRLLAINVEKPLRLRLQARLFFCLNWKKYFFVWWGGIIETTFVQSINKNTWSFSTIFYWVPEVEKNFFLSRFSFTTIHESQDCRERERTFL